MEFDYTQQLTKKERKLLAEEEKLVRLYEMRTRVDKKVTLDEQAEAMGVSRSTLIRMAKSEEYQRVAAKLAPKTVSPMIDVAKEYMADELLPLTLRSAKEILENPRTSATARVTLIGLLWKYSFELEDGGNSEIVRKDAIEFLTKQGVTINNIQIIMNGVAAPPGYAEELKMLVPDIIDGETVVVP
jgi:transcriptional regulator with XRE-family HTH domain